MAEVAGVSPVSVARASVCAGGFVDLSWIGVTAGLSLKPRIEVLEASDALIAGDRSGPAASRESISKDSPVPRKAKMIAEAAIPNPHKQRIALARERIKFGFKGKDKAREAEPAGSELGPE
jgi:hypothetical protein